MPCVLVSLMRKLLDHLGHAHIEHAVELMQSHNALSDTLVRARGYAQTARAALDYFPDGPHRAALEGVVDFCVDRAY